MVSTWIYSPEGGSKNEKVEAQIDSGDAIAVVSGGGIGTSPGSVSVTFTVYEDHPLVSVTSMVAPSPDWFVGLSGLDLCRNGNWISEQEFTLYAYDAGADSGITYTSANGATSTPELIRKLHEKPFPVDGFHVSMGVFSFTLKDE